MKLKKAGGNWVEDDRFFNREDDIAELTKRVKNGGHTLVTAQRRMGKTSLVRELLRGLREDDDFETVFVDVEDAMSPAETVAEIAAASRSLRGVWGRIQGWAGALATRTREGIAALETPVLRVELRSAVNEGNWRAKGDEVMAALAACDKRVVLAIDELPIFVNRLLKESDSGTSNGQRKADEYLSWLRKNSQRHQSVRMIVSGSIGLNPVLRETGLIDKVNVFEPWELKPWSQEKTVECLAALASEYDVAIPRSVRERMCRLLRVCVPHHVQWFFDKLHEHLRRAGRQKATVADVEQVFQDDLVSVRGRVVLEHYQDRLKMVLGPHRYQLALDVLTEAAVADGHLSAESAAAYRDRGAQLYLAPSDFDGILDVLEHDGYLVRCDGGHRFESGLLEAWWKARYAQHFTPIAKRGQ